MFMHAAPALSSDHGVLLQNPPCNICGNMPHMRYFFILRLSQFSLIFLTRIYVCWDIYYISMFTHMHSVSFLASLKSGLEMGLGHDKKSLSKFNIVFNIWFGHLSALHMVWSSLCPTHLHFSGLHEPQDIMGFETIIRWDSYISNHF
jgi:hypothetical protein